MPRDNRCMYMAHVYFYVRNASPRVPMCFRALVCQDLVSCYFCFVLLPLGSEKW